MHSILKHEEVLWFQEYEDIMQEASTKHVAELIGVSIWENR